MHRLQCVSTYQVEWGIKPRQALKIIPDKMLLLETPTFISSIDIILGVYNREDTIWWLNINGEIKHAWYAWGSYKQLCHGCTAQRIHKLCSIRFSVLLHIEQSGVLWYCMWWLSEPLLGLLDIRRRYWIISMTKFLHTFRPMNLRLSQYDGFRYTKH